MPTKRTIILFSLALALYFLANQTQVGWVYIMSNILAGLLLVTFLYPLGVLNQLQIRREFLSLSAQNGLTNRASAAADWLGQPTAVTSNIPEPPIEPTLDLFEDDLVAVNLTVTGTGLRPIWLVHGSETCPLAPPADQTQSLFIPSLVRHSPITVTYHTTCYRRGLFAFPPLELQSNGPFGLFRQRRTLASATELMVYPAYHPLKRIRLLEQRGFAGRQSLRVGASSDIIGTRDYRPGDSLRRIHWRSTARLGSLVVKELANEDQLTITVVLDLSLVGSSDAGKFSGFETAVRLAASLGYYATQHGLPFRLVGSSPRWRPPTTPLSWWGTLNYLAKVQNDGHEPLEAVLRALPATPFLVVLVSRPTTAISRALTQLHRSGTCLLALFITPDGQPSLDLPAARPNFDVRRVDPQAWSVALETL